MKNFTKFFPAFFFLFFIAKINAQNWAVQNSGTTQNLKDVFFVNNSLGFALGDSGIIKTSDGGNTWSGIFSGTGLVKLHFPTATTGYVSGMTNASLLKTTDGGNTWNDISPNIPNYSGGGIWFTSADTGYYAAGNFSTDCKILKTSDGGISWNTVFSDTTSIWISYFYFADANTGYATGSDGYVYKTTDAGNTWGGIYMGGNYWMSGVYFFDGNTGFVSGGNMGGGTHPIWKTTDGGANWQTVLNLSGSGGISWLQFADINTGYAVFAVNNGYGTLQKTTDGGNTWTNETTPGDSLYMVHFPSPAIGYAVGKTGTILKTFTPYGIWGTIYNKQQTVSINNGKIYLVEYDTVSVQLSYVDSFILGGGNGDYFFYDHPAGNYLILVRPDEVIYPNSIPTYYGDTAYWGYAKIMNLLSDTSGIDIRVRETPVWTGNGFCSGTIRFGLGSGKTGNGQAVPFGDPVPGIDVSLEQIPGAIIKAHTTTNDSGFYSIANIPMNTSYKLLVDIPGLPMDSSYAITINSSDSVVTDLDFVVDTTTGSAGIYIGYPLSAKENGIQYPGFIIYPNPCDGIFTLTSLSGNQPLTISIYNFLGEVILQSTINNQQSTIDISKQPKGIYFVGIQTKNELWVRKVAVD